MIEVHTIEAAKNITLTVEFNIARILKWREEGRFDEYTYENGEEVLYQRNGKTFFRGFLKEMRPVAGVENEEVEFTAVDAFEKLMKRIFIKSGTAQIEYNYLDKGQEEKNCWEIIQDILSTVTDIIPSTEGDTSTLTAIPPALSFSGSTVGEAILAVLRYQSTHGCFINPETGALKFVDFSGSLEEKSVYLGEIGERVEDHPEYNLKSCQLNPTFEGCITRVIIEGGENMEEFTETLQKNWDPAYETDWDYIKSIQYPDTYGKVFRYFKTTNPSNLPWTEGRISDTGFIENEAPLVEVEYKDKDGNSYWVASAPQHINYETGEVVFSKPIVSLLVRTDGRIVASGTWQYRQVRITVCKSLGKFFITREATDGTAYQKGYRADYYVYAWAFVKLVKNGQTLRDDTQKAIDFADKILALNKNEHIRGNAVIDTKREDFEYDLGQSVNFVNTKKWEKVFVRINSLTYQFDAPYEVQISLTSDPFIFNPEFFLKQKETQQKTKDLEGWRGTREFRARLRWKKPGGEEGDSTGPAGGTAGSIVVHAQDPSLNTIITDLSNPPRQSSLNLVLVWDPNETDPLNDPSRPGAWKAVAIYKPAP